MLSIRRPYRIGAANTVLPIAGGLVLGAIIAALVSTAPQQWILFTMAALLLLTLSFIVRKAKVYWLTVYLLLFMQEGGRGFTLTKSIVDPRMLQAALGIPPGQFALTLWPSDVVFLGLLTVWLLRVATRKERIHFHKAGYVALAYLAWVTISAGFKAQYYYLSWVELAQQYKYFVIFLYFSNAMDSKKLLKYMISVLMVALLWESTVTLAGWIYNPIYETLTRLYIVGLQEERWGAFVTDEGVLGIRAIGTFGIQGTAAYLELVLAFALVRFISTAAARRKALYAFLVSLGTAAVYVTYSRAAMLGLIGSSICIVYLARLRDLLKLRHLYIGLVLLIAVSPVVIWKLNTFFASRPETFRGRFELIDKGVRMFSENPLLGVGLNNSTAVKRQRFKGGFEGEDNSPIHSHYLILASESGLGGLVLYIGFFAVIAAEALRRSRSTDLDVAFLALPFVGIYAGMSLHLTGEQIGYVAPTMLWLYAGLVVALGKLDGAPRAPLRLARRLSMRGNLLSSHGAEPGTLAT